MNKQKIIQCLCCLALISIKVFACTTVIGGNPNLLPERQNKVLIFLAFSFAFVAGTFFLYFKKGKKGILPIIVSLFFFGISILTSSVYNGDCGDTALFTAKQGLLITFICFSFQFFTWLNVKKLANAELIK